MLCVPPPLARASTSRLGLPATQKALLLVDVFRAHLTDAVKAKLDANSIIMITVPVCATDLFQPCDQAGVNLKFKGQMKKAFEEHFQAELKRHMDAGRPPHDFILDQRLTSLRPKNHGWTANCLQIL